MTHILRFFALVVSVSAAGQESHASANPIRKVVTMLQSIQSKVMAEGKHQSELFDKFSCYCKKNGVDLSTSIDAGTNQIEALNVGLKTDTERKDQTKSNLQEHMTSRNEAKDTMAEATAMRKKEAGDFAKLKSDLETNLAALAKAIPAIEKGMYGSFLQTPAASVVRQFVMEKAVLPDNTRDELLAFLEDKHKSEYAPASGEILGILKQIQDEMTKSLAEATADENGAIANYQALMAAKKKEVATLQKQIEVEMTRVGDLEVKLAGMANDLADTQEALAADNAFKQNLEASCAGKAAQWDEIKKVRAEELLALSETIKTLNDDDALEIFSKTLPSTSLMQVEETQTSVQRRALMLIQEARQKATSAKMEVQPRLDFISLALRGKKIGFEKVVTMIDAMVSNLKTEQQQDDNKKEYCLAQFDQAEDKHKILSNAISDSEGVIDKTQSDIARLTGEIEALTAGIKELDAAVSDATDLRKKENAEHKDLITSDTTAKEVLKWAQNRLRKFYEPALYKPPPEAQLSEEDRITVNFGGTLSTTPAGGIAGTGIGAFVQISLHSDRRAAPPPPPETFGPYTKKGGESRGVIAMIDVLIKDLDQEMQESTVNEKNGQEEYEEMMAKSAAKRTKDAKAVTDKSMEKAAAQDALEAEQAAHAAASKELMGTDKYISSLHGECDWLLQYFEARKMARASEVESLNNARAVLSGADYSLVQQRSVSRHLRAHA